MVIVNELFFRCHVRLPKLKFPMAKTEDGDASTEAWSGIVAGEYGELPCDHVVLPCPCGNLTWPMDSYPFIDDLSTKHGGFWFPIVLLNITMQRVT